jgi:hypothetical protein
MRDFQRTDHPDLTKGFMCLIPKSDAVVFELTEESRSYEQKMSLRRRVKIGRLKAFLFSAFRKRLKRDS